MKRPILWGELLARIERALADHRIFSESHPSLVIKPDVAPDGNSLILHRKGYPQVTVTVVFNDPSIELRFSYKKTEDSEVVKWDDTIQLPLDHNDEVYFQYRGKAATVENVALLLLTPVRDPLFIPPIQQS
jgi:hypothetical protein